MGWIKVYRHLIISALLQMLTAAMCLNSPNTFKLTARFSSNNQTSRRSSGKRSDIPTLSTVQTIATCQWIKAELAIIKEYVWRCWISDFPMWMIFIKWAYAGLITEAAFLSRRSDEGVMRLSVPRSPGLPLQITRDSDWFQNFTTKFKVLFAVEAVSMLM